jgi:hypothetical protein
VERPPGLGSIGDGQNPRGELAHDPITPSSGLEALA